MPLASSWNHKILSIFMAVMKIIGKPRVKVESDRTSRRPYLQTAQRSRWESRNTRFLLPQIVGNNCEFSLAIWLQHFPYLLEEGCYTSLTDHLLHTNLFQTWCNKMMCLSLESSVRLSLLRRLRMVNEYMLFCRFGC